VSAELNLDRSSRTVVRGGTEYESKNPEKKESPPNQKEEEVAKKKKPEEAEPEEAEPEKQKKGWTASDDEQEISNLPDALTKQSEEPETFTIEQAIQFYRAGAILQGALKEISVGFRRMKNTEHDVKISSVETVVLNTMASFEGEGEEEIGSKTVTETKTMMAGMSRWIKTGDSNKTKKPKKKKEPYKPSPEALACVKVWAKTIGLPPKASAPAVYAESFDQIHLIDKQSWTVIDEIIVAIKAWQDKGIAILSPLALRTKTRSNDGMKWESAWTQYRTSATYKPLGPPPKCPECNKPLMRGQITRKEKTYSAFLCTKHPEKSLPVGRNFCPEKRT